MSLLLRRSTIAVFLLVAACSGGSGAATGGPTATAPGYTPAAAATTGAVAGEPCSFLTAEQIAAAIGTTPVSVAERIGRGDCDYWLDAAKTAKVNVGVFTGADAASLFEQTKGIGTPQVVQIGDEAYSIDNPSIGTIVVAKKGTSVVSVQVFTTAPAADRLRQATALVESILGRL